MNKDIEWQQIKLELDGENPENFFEAFKNIISEIEPFLGKELDSKEIISVRRLLYGLDGLYIKYKYSDEADSEYWRSHKYSGLGAGLGNHNYNAFLRYLDCALLNGYYAKMVEGYKEFLETKMPIKYLYTAYKDRENKRFIINCNKFITIDDLPDEIKSLSSASKNVNRYYSLSQKLPSLEEYLELFKGKNISEDGIKEFCEIEYPIYEYLRKTEPREQIYIPTEFKRVED